MYQYLLQRNAKLKHLSVLLIVICKTSITACCHFEKEECGALAGLWRCARQEAPAGDWQ